MEITQAILTSSIGFIGGLVLTFITPWVKWRNERLKIQYSERTELFDDFKKMIEADSINKGQIVNSTSYIIIKKHLSEESIKYLEKTNKSIVRIYAGSIINHVDNEKIRLYQDLGKLANKWKII